jgi:subfamily B ATP-binding cassette protein MsbA
VARSPFRRFLGLCRPQRAQILLGILLVLAATALTLPVPWILKLLIDRVLPARDLRLLAQLLAVFAALSAFRAAFTFARNRILQYASMRLVCDLRIRTFAHLQTLGLRYFDSRQTGETASRIAQDCAEIYNLTNGFLINLVADSVTLVVVIGFLYFIHWRLALVASAVLPLLVLNYLQQRRSLREEAMIHRQNWDSVVGFLHEKLSATRVIRAFVKERSEVSAFTGQIDADYYNFSRVIMRNTKLSVMADLLGSLGTLLVLAYGSWLVMSGQMAVGTLVAFSSYIAFVFPPLVRLADLNSIFQRSMAGLENVFRLLDTAPEVTDPDGAEILTSVRGDVEFRHVSFDYALDPPGAGRPRTLTDVSFAVPAGQVVAIVGPSGSGKSTLINLIARFYDPAEGQVLVDGRDIREFRMDSYRAQIGIVLQDNVLFSGTLEDNLRYGRPEATRAEVVAAAQAANAHEFILGLPLDYLAVVGERGAQLSGGQRQRIAIARTLLKNPRILMLDEATSALDPVSERLVQEATERLMRGRTTFIIAHRLSTIHRADLILVLDQGRVVERGTHAQLLGHPGLYSRLHALQFQNPA